VPQIMDATALREGGPGSVGLNAAACSRCPEEVRQRRSSAMFVSPRSRTGAIADQRVPLRQRMRAARKLLFGPAKTAGG
jgi:hypothetical protein